MDRRKSFSGGIKFVFFTLLFLSLLQTKLEIIRSTPNIGGGATQDIIRVGFSSLAAQYPSSSMIIKYASNDEDVIYNGVINETSTNEM